MDYYTQKAKRMYQLFLKGVPCKKVYGAVCKGGRYVVIKNANDAKWRYQIAGGGVEEGETNEVAILREVAEELNINAKIVKSLGVLTYKTTWRYENKEFVVDNEAEIFLLEFVSCSHNAHFGLEGEFARNVEVALISKHEMIKNVYEFAKGGIKLI